jgi:uroporphyrinogen III methyltransferase/synthase
VSTLAGKRILVTRPPEQAEKTAASIRVRGADPVLVPLISLHPPKDPAAARAAIARASEHPWVAFTSANGVERALAFAVEIGTGAAAFEGAKLAAIGSGTAAALEAHGLRADVVATESRGEGLARALLDAMAPGDSLLLLRAAVARDVLPGALRAAGHPVEVVSVYETRAASGPEVARVLGELERGEIDAVTFTSASAVESFLAVAGGREESMLARTIVASIGPITSDALAARGLRADVTAAKTTLEGLLDALEARFVNRPL